MPKLQLAPLPRERRDVIVVGSDLAETSDAALSYGLYLGRALAARVIIVHIAAHIELKKGRQKPLVRNDLLTLQRVIESQRAVAEEQLAKQLRRTKTRASEAESEVRSGRPSRDLLLIAQKKRAMLLVLGGGEQGTGLGHVTQRILSGSRVPVVVVPVVSGKRSSAPNAKLHLVAAPAGRRAPSSRAVKVVPPLAVRPDTKDQRMKRRALERWENEGGRPSLRPSSDGLGKGVK